MAGSRHRPVRQACVAAQAALRTSTRSLRRVHAGVRHALSLPASVLLLVVAVALPVVTFAAAFQVSDRVTAGDIWRRKGYFLSAAIDVEPASNFGALGLTLSLAAFMCVAVVRHHVVAERCRAAGVASTLGCMHVASLTFAIAAAVGGNGVAAFQHRANRHAHNAFAAIFVLFALAHFMLESTLERRAGLSSRLARASRLTLVLVATAGCATFITHVVIEESRGANLGIGKLRAASAEIITCLCFLGYIATYSRSFHETRITLSVTVPTATPPVPTPTPTLKVEEAAKPKAACNGIRRCASASAALGARSFADAGLAAPVWAS